jgi:hypothetical protein
MSSGEPSVISNPAIKEKNTSEKTPSKKAGLEDKMEYNVVVRLPPNRSRFVELEITSIKKAEPKIVALEPI